MPSLQCFIISASLLVLGGVVLAMVRCILLQLLDDRIETIIANMKDSYLTTRADVKEMINDYAVLVNKRKK